MAYPDYQGAAGRFLRDANTLLAEERWASAAYLSGYVVECSLKALLRAACVRVPKIHNLQALKQAVQSVAGGKRRKIGDVVRKPLRCPMETPRDFDNFDYSNSDDQVTEWHPSLRYQPDRVVNANRTRDWVHGARDFYNHTIRKLKHY